MTRPTLEPPAGRGPAQEFRSRILAIMQAHEGDLEAGVNEAAEFMWRVVQETCRRDDRWAPKKQRGREAS